MDKPKNLMLWRTTVKPFYLVPKSDLISILFSDVRIRRASTPDPLKTSEFERAYWCLV